MTRSRPLPLGALGVLLLGAIREAYSNTYVTKALSELKADGVDTVAASWAPITVTLKEGGK